MICVMQNHIIQAFANTGNAIKPVSFIRDLKSKYTPGREDDRMHLMWNDVVRVKRVRESRLSFTVTSVTCDDLFFFTR